MKLGFTTGIVGKVIPLPRITLEQKRRYAIGSACSVYKEKSFCKWADDWISGKDRSREAVRGTSGVGRKAAEAALAARAVARAAARVAWAARAVARAARAAAWAARDTLDLIRIAEWAMTDEPLSELLGDK